MSAEIDAQKLEILRTALPKGVGGGDGGLVEARGTPDIMNSFPQFRSNLIQSQKTYNASPLSSAESAPPLQPSRVDNLPHPWQIRIRTKPDTDPPEYEFLVELNSSVYQSLSSWDKVTVTGLNFWTTVQEGYVVLEGEVNENGIVSNLEINGPLEELPERIKISEGPLPIQTNFAIELGYLYQDENGKWKVIQTAFQNLTLYYVSLSGVLCKIPMPQ